MNYIEFDREKLVNIPFSKSRELVRCSRTGAYSTTTLLGLNTRKYHGLFIVPQDNIDHERHVLVSNLNETIVLDNMEFHLSMHQYKGGIIDPKGNKYLQKFAIETIPIYHFRVGKFNFTKELLFSDESERIIIKYTILDHFESAFFQFQPLLAFRQIHQLTHANEAVNKYYELVSQGVKYCLYDHYTPIYLQCSEEIFYEHNPLWYYDFEYEEEIKRGYNGHEDLITMGKINVKVNQKEIYFSIGTEPIAPDKMAEQFN
ncbi:MAG: glycogen debranching enzyme N-terminal domain-containing protein, partial [Bacteroidales bacterium]